MSIKIADVDQLGFVDDVGEVIGERSVWSVHQVGTGGARWERVRENGSPESTPRAPWSGFLNAFGSVGPCPAPVVPLDPGGKDAHGTSTCPSWDNRP
jgi:hypothetical protein